MRRVLTNATQMSVFAAIGSKDTSKFPPDTNRIAKHGETKGKIEQNGTVYALKWRRYEEKHADSQTPSKTFARRSDSCRQFVHKEHKRNSRGGGRSVGQWQSACAKQRPVSPREGLLSGRSTIDFRDRSGGLFAGAIFFFRQNVFDFPTRPYLLSE
jgi:hypothetical protein